MAHTIDHGGAQAPKTGRGALLAWIAVPLLLGLLLIVGIWLVPALESNSEEEPGRPPASGVQTGDSQR